MIDWADGLIGDLARRRVVLVIGAGVSRHSVGKNSARPPLWKEFLEGALADCPKKDDLAPVVEAIKNNDLLHACEWLKKRFDEQWTPYLRRKFMTPAYEPAAIHQSILSLDSRIVFSLNFDDIYERHVNSINKGSYIVKTYYDEDVEEFLRGSSRFVIKVHGNMNTPNKIIFTQSEYSRARLKNNTFYQAFDAALLTHTFLFIGSGFNDPDINLVLENQNFGFPAQSPHYFLSASGMSEDQKKSLRENRNLKVIDYDPVDNNHIGLVKELDVLGAAVEEERYKIANSGTW